MFSILYSRHFHDLRLLPQVPTLQMQSSNPTSRHGPHLPLLA
jgi:hypothetical protein